MRVVCVSDTHGLHEDALAVPPGDVFVHAGDFTDTGARDEVLAFDAFLARLPHRYKLVIAGNHESTFDRAFYQRNWYHYGHRQQFDPDEVRALLTNALYLEDQAVLIDGFKFYGTPWQPEFCNWAFNLPRGDKLLDKWRRIPSDTDVLISHTPPQGRGDQVGQVHVGCEDLLREVQTRIKPALHVFGHVHEGYGSSSDGVTTFVNASACTHDYAPVNPPLVFDLDAPRTKVRTGDPTLDYARLLHEQLRACSQKPPFKEEPAPPNGFTRIGSDHIGDHGGRGEDQGATAPLRAFRVEGTAAALLFESTLRVRPVRDSQSRALRYLFSQGFRTSASSDESAADGSRPASPDKERPVSRGDRPSDDVHELGGDAGDGDQDAGDGRRLRRRQLAIARRVTVAVLNDLVESKEMTGPDREQLEQASIASESLIEEAAGHHVAAADGAEASGSLAAPARRRRDKTLRKRDGRTKLSTLVEEPVGAQTGGAMSPEAADAKPSGSSPSAAAASAVMTTATGIADAEVAAAPAPTATGEDCVLCKYKVPGHAHPGCGAPPPAPSPSPLPASAPASVGEPQATPVAAASPSSPRERLGGGDPAAATGDSRGVNACKRLSSWF